MELLRQGRAFSGYERHHCFLNTRDGRFTDVSAVSGIDYPEDGRGMAYCDWDFDGDLDLWISHRTGPQVRLVAERRAVRPADDGRAAGGHFLQS